jgi:hypothetical protein
MRGLVALKKTGFYHLKVITQISTCEKYEKKLY